MLHSTVLRIIAVGTRPVCVEAAKGYGATGFHLLQDGPPGAGHGASPVAVTALWPTAAAARPFEDAVKAPKPGGKIATSTTRFRRLRQHSLASSGCWWATRDIRVASCLAAVCAWRSLPQPGHFWAVLTSPRGYPPLPRLFVPSRSALFTMRDKPSDPHQASCCYRLVNPLGSVI